MEIELKQEMIDSMRVFSESASKAKQDLPSVKARLAKSMRIAAMFREVFTQPDMSAKPCHSGLDPEST